ncbi:MAG: M48 family metallopeptidase [Nitrosopumilus sp.]|uniref:M48 family metallopeptidase n=1 Tax=Nitrosopumilus sp. TaxID=2024843 RepID=UPI00247ED52C|nr:M48 family metallopeptidase [Nitrosopumilus sp.]MCV0392103.1 M48 family metallopeptidase [Nitrosopumilus sp.]
MKDKIRFGNSSITYTISKSKRRKTSQIIVDSKGVQVQTPLSKTNSEIKKMVTNKKEWIFKKRLEFQDKKNRKRVKTKTKTLEYLERRTWKLASKIGVKPSQVVVKKLKSRWGSAGKTGIITLNEVLLKTPPRIIDYVIIHELCHLKIRNHSSKFWSLLYSHDKKFQDKINWLELHSKELFKKK